MNIVLSAKQTLSLLLMNIDGLLRSMRPNECLLIPNHKGCQSLGHTVNYIPKIDKEAKIDFDLR